MSTFNVNINTYFTTDLLLGKRSVAFVSHTSPILPIARPHAHRMLHRIRLCLLLIVFLTVLAPLQGTTNHDRVEQAIAKCRDKLSRDPTFPPAQFLLGKLLESIPGSNLHEVAELSWQAGSCEDRPLEHSQRIEALLRAATIYTELDDDRRAFIAYTDALARISDQVLVEQVLHECTALLVSQLGTAATVVSATSDADADVPLADVVSQLATDLIHRFPQSVVAWQFQGAIARKLGHDEIAYQSYHTACDILMTKKDEDDDDTSASVAFLEMVVESNILASSAARRAGKSMDVQMMYLERAYLQCTRGGDEWIAVTTRTLLSEPPQKQQQQQQQMQRLQAEILIQMGTVQKAAGNRLEAIRCFQRALDWKPGDGHAVAQLASLVAVDSTESEIGSVVAGVQHLDTEYVRDLFDGYSARFEDELVNLLEYQGHEWVAHEAVQAFMSDDVRDTWGMKQPQQHQLMTMVDLGCGTGLVGDALVGAFKNLFANPPPLRILGVDLSHRMVKLAAAKRVTTTTGEDKKIYESVHQADAVTYLKEIAEQQTSSSIHGIVAADVFIYVGNLQAIFESSRVVLVDSGVIVFSVELLPLSSDEEDQGKMILLPSGRFGHSKQYIEREAKQAGFVMKVWKEGILRKQRGENVRGAVVVLQKIPS
jgi:predicted TPR repeat methyltransferase